MGHWLGLVFCGIRVCFRDRPLDDGGEASAAGGCQGGGAARELREQGTRGAGRGVEAVAGTHVRVHGDQVLAVRRGSSHGKEEALAGPVVADHQTKGGVSGGYAPLVGHQCLKPIEYTDRVQAQTDRVQAQPIEYRPNR